MLIIVISLLFGNLTIISAHETANNAPQQGGTLRIAFGKPLYETDPILLTWTGSNLPFANIYNRLLTRAPDWSIIPELAHSYDIEDKATKFTFHLEENVKFHDGTPMTSADVLHTFYAAYGFINHMKSEGLKSITTPDDYTVIFEFENSCDLRVFIGGLGQAFIKPKHIYEAPGIDWETLHTWTETERDIYKQYSHTQVNITEERWPIGTGPFQFVGYDGKEFRFHRFEDYWEEGLPYLDELIYVIYPDVPDNEYAAITSLLDLTMGKVDALHSWHPKFQLEYMDFINRTNDFTVDTMGNYGTYRITFNMNPESSPKDPLSAKPDEQWVLNKDVRIAMEYAINKEAIVQDIYFNGLPAQYTAIPNFVYAYNDALEHRTYDIEKAEQLLDAAGYTVQPDGYRLHNVTFKIYDTISEMGEMIAADLQAVGIDATSVPINPGIFVKYYELGDEMGGPLWNAIDEYQEAFGVNHQAAYSTSSLIDWLYTLDETKRGFYNFGHYSNPQVDALLILALESTNLMDQTEYLKAVQEIVWNENPLIFISGLPRCEVWNNRYAGFNPSNRPLAIYGSYKKVYDTQPLMISTITGGISEFEQTTIAIIIGMFGSIGLVLRKLRNRNNGRY